MEVNDPTIISTDSHTDLNNHSDEHQNVLENEIEYDPSIQVSEMNISESEIEDINQGFFSENVSTDSIDSSEKNVGNLGINRKNISKQKKITKDKILTDTSEKRSIEIKIGGVPYKIKSNHDDETMNRLIHLVNDKISDAIKYTKNGSFQNAAVLASLNLAEELLILKKQANELLLNLEIQTQKLKSDLKKLNLVKTNKNHSQIQTEFNSDEINSNN